MKAKTIKAVLAKKTHQWIETIDDNIVKKLMKDNVIITGGCITSMLLQEPVNDFDIYLRTEKAALAIAEYYVKKFNEMHGRGLVVKLEEGKGVRVTNGQRGETAGDFQVLQDPGDIEETYQQTEEAAQQIDDEPKYRPVFLSTNAITLSSKIQIVLRFYGEPDDIHKNYDFVHCTNYWSNWDSHLELRKEALEAILARELRYVGSKYPICSIIRLRKFIKRGWSVNAGQILKMIMQVSELDLTNIEVLRDQLTGVDVAYFNEVLDRLKAKDSTKVNGAYLIEIIDRMF